MAQILPETEVAEVEGRTYINPQIAVGESDTFIDNLRQTQQANTEQIAQDTYDLGTAVPSNLGGLMGRRILDFTVPDSSDQCYGS